MGSKKWTFNTSGSAWQIGLAAEFIQQASTSGTVLTRDTYTWAQSSSGNPYIATKVSVADEASSNPASAETTQTVDAYGNMTQMVVYPYNNTTTPLQTYNNTMLTASGYLSNYIRNRVLTTTLTTSAGTKTLAQNYYDGTTEGSQPTPSYSCSSTYGAYGYGTNPREWDSTKEVWFGGEGMLTETVTPALSTCLEYYVWGPMYSETASDGTSIQASTS